MLTNPTYRVSLRPINVYIRDTTNTIIASGAYTSPGSYSFTFTPSSSNSDYTLEYYVTDASGLCYFTVDNISISSPSTTYITVCDTLNAGDYRYGFQAQEKDDEVKGRGNSLNYTYRMHDARLGRFFAVDPLTDKYPFYTPYSFSGNEVINSGELEGLEPVLRTIGVFTTAPKLNSPSEWYVNQYLNPSGGSSIVSTDWKSFDKANMYNTNNINVSAYSNIEVRHEYYGWVASKLSSGNGRHWFQAAKIVTSWNAVGAAEGVNAHYLTDDAEHYLKYINRNLMYSNMFNAKMLIQNGKLERSFTDANGNEQSFKGLSGLELDLKLVEFEQSEVQRLTTKYSSTYSHKNMNDIFKSLKKSFSSAPFQNRLIKSVLKDNFTNKGVTFDFSNYEHRVTLGQELVKKLHQNEE